MQWIFDMALRNIRRNRRRTILAVSSIFLSVLCITFLGGFAGGILENMVRNITKNDTGHIRIVTSGFESRERFMPLDESLQDPQQLQAAINAIPDIQDDISVMTERIMFGTMLSNGPNTRTAMGLAGDLATERSLINLDRSVVEGRYPESSGETLLGRKLAQDLGLAVGDRLRVVTQGADYGLRLKSFTISGLFATGQNQLDDSFFLIPLEDAKRFLRTDGGSQQILIMLNNYRKAPAIAARIQEALGAEASGLSIKPWTQLGDYGPLIRYMETVYNAIYVVIAFLGAFIITNILMMVVLERRREIGILKALGLKRREVLLLFLSEGAVMGGIGSALGALVGLGLNILLSIVGMDFSRFMEAVNFPIDPVYYNTVSIPQVFLMFCIGLGVSVAVSVLPSRQAADMNAVDAIKSAV